MSTQPWIEQAIFTSARSAHREGYHLVASSPGILPEDARELVTWGPTHDSLNHHCPVAGSLNFHPLPSGAHCISRSTAAGAEYSDRGGTCVYTQCLVVPREVLGRFAWNAFRVAEAATAAGHLQVLTSPPATLPTLRLVGRASIVDVPLLEHVIAQIGAETLMALMASLATTPTVALTAALPPEQLMGAMISLIPPPCRPLVAFSTGLSFSPRRPYQLLAVDPQSAAAKTLDQRTDVLLWQGAAPPVVSLPAWAESILSWLRRRDWDRLQASYRELAEGMTWDDLPQHHWTLPQTAAIAEGATRSRRPVGEIRVAHAPHREECVHPECPLEVELESQFPEYWSQLHPEIQSCVQELGRVLVTTLQQGEGADKSRTTPATASLEDLWSKLCSTCEERLLEAIRETAMQQTVTTWLAYDRADSRRAIAAMDIVGLLFCPQALAGQTARRSEDYPATGRNC